MSKTERFRCFEVLQYEESMRGDLWERLADVGIPVAAQLHDRDVYTVDEYEKALQAVNAGQREPPDWRPGDTKKTHWHILFYLPSKRYANGFSVKKFLTDVTEPLGIPGHLVKTKRDKVSALRYLVHLDHPDKAQYDPQAMKFLNGFPQPKFTSSSKPDWGESVDAAAELEQMIIDSDLTEYGQLVELLHVLRTEDVDKYRVLQWTLMRNSHHFARVLDSRRHERLAALSAADLQVQRQRQRAARWSDVAAVMSEDEEK